MTGTLSPAAAAASASAPAASRPVSSRPASAVPGRFVTVSVLMLAAMTIMANATISPSLPGLRDHFAGTPGIDTLVGLLLTLPSLSVMLTAGLFGMLADRTNRLVLVGIAAGLYAAGGASGLVADELWQMLAGRALLGVGVAGTMTLAMAFSADLFHGPARARFMGLQGASMSAGGIIVLLAGGLLAGLHWRGAFAVYLLVLPIAAMAIVALARHARQAAAASGHRSGPGGHDVAPGELAEGPFPWGVFSFASGLAFLFMASYYAIPTLLPFRLQTIGIDNTLLVGMVLASGTLTALPGSLFYGRIRRHVSSMTVFAGSFLFMGAGHALIGLSDGVGGIVAGVLLIGIGMGPGMPNYTTFVMNRVPAAMRGRAAGFLATAFFAGQFASPLVTRPLVAALAIPGMFLTIGLALVVLGAALSLRALADSRAPRTLGA